MRRLVVGLAMVLAACWMASPARAGFSVFAHVPTVGGRVTWNGRAVIRVLTPDGFPSVAWRAGVIAGRLALYTGEGPLDAALLMVRAVGREAVLEYDGHLLATADLGSARLAGMTPLRLAASWADNLARAAGAPAVSLNLVAAEDVFQGLASWYGPGFAGNRTSDGELFDPNLFTAASRSLPFNTLLAVTDLRTGRTTLVRVNDRGPWVAGRVLDLSAAAAAAIGLRGVDPVECRVVGRAG